MKTKSIWEGTANQIKSYDSLNQDIEAEVVIIGGGITGITAGLLLSQAGKKVVILEAHKIGVGTTGNSTGNLYVTVDENLSGIKSKWNKDVMNSVVRSRTAALDFIEKTTTKFNIDCDFKRTFFSYYAEKLNDEIDEFIKKEYDALKEVGLQAQILENPSFPFEVKKTLSVSNQAQFHPLKYIRGIAEKISDKCHIYEDSKVIEFDEDKGFVKTEKGSVKANYIIMATHTPKGVFAVHTVLGAYREFGVAAELKNSSCPEGIFWGLNSPKHSVRSFKASRSDYVMVIGDKFKTGQHGDSEEHIKGLESYLKDRFDVNTFNYVWGGQHYRAADGIPYIGKHGDRMYLATGFATDGLVYGTLASMIITDQILGKKNPFEDTFKADRFTPLKSAKEFIKENADNLVEYLKDVPWNVDSDTLRGLQPGQAKIIEKDGEKIGVFKDNNGTNHIVSAVCTHMSCIVNWNDSEKSWDCPCHGSRFTSDGEVIEGPAIFSLKKQKTN
jgi:glycine/D-amino acid oxidase-like deaminating enzyme/nitrite reductase/ring-hydroxylating ferredoxin subunit